MDTLKLAAGLLIRKATQALVKKAGLVVLPYLVVFLLGAIVILGVFGALPPGADPGRDKIKEYVRGIVVPVQSKYGQEQDFALPWGLVYALEAYAGNWQAEPDMRRVARITAGLQPSFAYLDYREKFVTTYHYTDEEGNSHSYTVTSWEEVKLLTQAGTYEGFWLFQYEEVTETIGNTSHTYLKPAGREFITDYARLDGVIAGELGLDASVETVTLGGGDLAWPVPASQRVSSPFGMRIHPVSGKHSLHTGIDIPAATGCEVVAAGDGVVRQAKSDDIYGWMVLLDHGEGFSTMYGHNSRILVEPGQQVRRGERIAEVGSTGVSTGPHLHFEVRRQGDFLDPLGEVKLPAGIRVAVQDNIDRRVILETGAAFMKGEASLEWLQENN